MRKLLVLAGLCLAFCAAPAMATVDLGLPNDSTANFDGNGVFTQFPTGSFDQYGPLPEPAGSQIYGVGTISDVSIAPDYGVTVWQPSDVGPNFEMTFTFWNAVVTSSMRTWTGTPGSSNALLTAEYADGARLLLVSDTSKDFSTAFGPGAFDRVDGEYPTAYTLEDAGYDDNGQPDASSMFTYADDPGEEVFLDLQLNGNSSVLTWSPSAGFLTGSFISTDVYILGGAGASQFLDMIGADGRAFALIYDFSQTGWMFAADIDIQLTTVPEPATLIFLGTGLASLIGYKLRRKMA